jgi:flagellar protein FliO/FliZ
MSGVSLLQTGLALLLVIGLVLLLGWGVQRLGGTRRTRDISVISQVSLGQRERVVVVAWDGQEWMLGVGPGRVQLIAQREGMDAPVEAAAPATAVQGRPSLPQAFALQLQQTLTRWGAR